MFTGIVEELGDVVAVEDAGATPSGSRVRGAARRSSDAALGDSIAVNGVLPDRRRRATTARSPPTSCSETLDRPRSAALAPGDRVNLERAVTADDAARRPHRAGPRRRHRHRRSRATPSEHWEVVEISLPADLAPLRRREGLDHRRRRLA